MQHIDIKRENINILDGNASDLNAECAQYEEKILHYGMYCLLWLDRNALTNSMKGGIELFLAGIGADGHVISFS